MEIDLKNSYLTKKQLVEKYKFLSENMVKNFLHKNIDNVREKCVHRLGRRVLFNEAAFLNFLNELQKQ